MKCAIVCLVLFVTMASAQQVLLKLSDHWQTFKSANNKKYQSTEEESKRQEIFKQNIEKVLENNLAVDLGQDGHKLGINQFADMTHEEFKNTMLGLRMDGKNRTLKGAQTVESQTILTAPASADWRAYMGPIKNQGSCGSCWAFTVTGVLEGHTAIYKGQRVVLSEQNLVDCASSYGNYGCQGGMPDYAFQYVIDNGGLDSAQCYMYEGQDNYCRYNPQCNSATMRSFVDVQPNERALMEAVGTRGPVAIGMDAGQQDLMMYSGGIYNNPQCSSTQLNHAVVIVGYGSEGGRDYWLIRNSWGSQWGLGGHFKLARGVNRCGIMNTASYPVV